MAVKVAINGFGRIGRNVLRAIIESGRTDIEVVALNDLGPVETNAHLMRYDSVHGRFPGTVTVDGDTIDVGRGPIRVTAIRNPAELPWGDVDVALECTGLFASKEKAGVHLQANADELQFVVGELASDLLRGPSHLLRSIQHGWEMKPIAMGGVPADVIVAAINALDASGLDVGAVHVEDVEGSAVVNNVIAAPGLDDDQLTLYVDAIKAFSGAKVKTSARKKTSGKKDVSQKGEVASTEIIAKLTRKVRMGKISQAKAEELMAAMEE